MQKLFKKPIGGGFALLEKKFLTKPKTNNSTQTNGASLYAIRGFLTGQARVLIISLFATLACAGIIKAATTIGNNITTGGTITSNGANTLYGATSVGGALTATSTLNVSGLTTLGNASTTLLSVSGTQYIGGDNGLILSDGSILDASGAISFGNENLTTTGTLNVSELTTLGNASTTVLSVSGSFSASGIVASGIIQSTSGGIKFPDGTIQTGANAAATNAELEQRISIATWGDSLTGSEDFVTDRTSYPSYLSSSTGYKVLNGGVGGETSVQIKNRMLAATDKYGYPTIILAGWNDINSLNNSAAITQVKASIASMVAALTTDKYIIVSVYTGSALNLYANIMQLNQDLATIYGSHFVNVRSYLVSKYDPAIPQDVTDYGNDIIPSSLRQDSIHLNSTGNRYAADKIFENISLLGFSNTASLTPDNWRYLTRDGFVQSGNTVLNVSPVNNNIHLGLLAGDSMTPVTTGNSNVIIGTEAMSAATTSTNNIAIGFRSMYGLTGDGGISNIGIGTYALRNNLIGAYNIAVGDNALRSTTASYNTSMGVSAGRTISTGTYNTFLGYYAGYNGSQLATASNSTAIGNGAYTTASNQVVLGNSSVLNTVLRGSVNIESKTTMPSTCSVGDIITDGDGTVGLCLCTAANTWSGLTSSAGTPDCN